MKKTYEEISKVFDHERANGKVFVSHFKSVEDLLSDGMDVESLDSGYFVFGSGGMQPSELKEEFIIIEESGSTDLPIFISEMKDEVLYYLEDNHKEYMK